MNSISRALFIASGVLWMVIGVLTPLLMGKVGPPIVFASPRTDTALFGQEPDALLDANRPLAIYRVMAWRTIAGLLLAVGAFTIGVAWFGLRPPTAWALGLLTFVGLAVLPYWDITFAPYRDAGVPLGIFDIPPLMWVPGVLMPGASVLGWIDYAAA